MISPSFAASPCVYSCPSGPKIRFDLLLEPGVALTLRGGRAKSSLSILVSVLVAGEAAEADGGRRRDATDALFAFALTDGPIATVDVVDVDGVVGSSPLDKPEEELPEMLGVLLEDEAEKDADKGGRCWFTVDETSERVCE